MQSRVQHLVRSAVRRGAYALLLAAGLGACGSDGPGPTDEVEGVWAFVSDTADAVYLRIEGDSIWEYTEDGLADCFELTEWRITDIEGDRFRLKAGERERTVFLRIDEDDLLVEVSGSTARYTSSDANPETLPLCQPTNPGADCATLPLLTMDQTLDGAIAGSDEANPDGSHYDLYRVQMADPLAVEIEMASTEVDSYLVLYDSAGAFIEQNDDASTLTLDARLTPSLTAGCFILMATTSFAAEFGEYELSLSTP